MLNDGPGAGGAGAEVRVGFGGGAREGVLNLPTTLLHPLAVLPTLMPPGLSLREGGRRDRKGPVAGAGFIPVPPEGNSVEAGAEAWGTRAPRARVSTCSLVGMDGPLPYVAEAWFGRVHDIILESTVNGYCADAMDAPPDLPPPGLSPPLTPALLWE